MAPRRREHDLDRVTAQERERCVVNHGQPWLRASLASTCVLAPHPADHRLRHPPSPASHPYPTKPHSCECPRQTAGDVAYSLNEPAAYEALLGEGVRAELIKAAMEAAGLPSATDEDEEEDAEGSKLSTASDNATFLASSLVFTTDARGQEICVDKEVSLQS